MTMFLKQSTAVTIKLGPFLDSTDGNTVEGSLTLSQADFRLSKNGGDMAQKNESTAGAHDELGYYDVLLDTTDTNTLGRLKVMVHESGALPVWADYMVVPANVWDSLFGADKLQVHVDEMTAGIITATVIATDAIDADAMADGAITAGVFADDAITAAKIADNAITELQNGLATAASIATLQTSVDDLPTNAELATSQAAADDATLAAIAALNNLSAAQVNAEVDTALADYDAPTKAELDSAVATLATAANLATLAAYVDTEVAAILAAVDTEVGTLVTNVAAILADTGTDGVVLSTATQQAIADAVLTRSASNTEGSAGVYSLTALILAAFESAISGATWTIKRTDGSTTFATRTVTTDADAEPIVGVE